MEAITSVIKESTITGHIETLIVENPSIPSDPGCMYSEMDSKERLERRRAKFSEQRRQELLNDPLQDKGLLSRGLSDPSATDSSSDSNAMTRLMNHQKYRDQLFEEIKQLPASDERVEHGLRKLREIIISIRKREHHDPPFLKFTDEVYIYSANYYLDQEHIDWTKLLGVLSANSTSSKEFLTCKTLYHSIELREHTHSIQAITLSSHLFEHPALCKNIILSCALDNPHQWFTTLAQFKDHSPFLYKFLSRLPYHRKSINEIIKTISKSYRQLSLEYISQFWFASVPIPHLKQLIASLYTTIDTPSGSTIVKFAQKT
ncbi:hypothetical protein KLMA_20044 [Kluyveromyces marxianus DMKU3-1042]|uniref:Uncharacterized protein n=1 Tax=Kluyveromyces marxianus (strain DMKU3-1042 / BCC 29191 / NBRC 104275) TaxID=1003335 RepID=W0T4G9_KLUMD|nr:hypothetical protein KLMA_20044 [Kluyveromyces marxianus DMKU3-1042]BAO38502.1 hypothetical protein KLMA_20044 [Kluyveromyces marxianus DMKU3-1042]